MHCPSHEFITSFVEGARKGAGTLLLVQLEDGQIGQEGMRSGAFHLRVARVPNYLSALLALLN